MPRAKLEITLPEGTWIRDVSGSHPDATFRVLAALPGGDAGVGLLEIEAPELSTVLSEIEAADAVTSMDLLRVVDEEALLQFETTDALLLMSIRDSMIPFEPPVLIRDTVATMEVTASRDRLSELGEQLEAMGMPFEVRYVRTTVDSTDLLTEPQRRLLLTAVEAGYYDTPRECTLTDLADRVGVAKSTASERLHRAEEAVIKEFVEGLDAEVDSQAPTL